MDQITTAQVPGLSRGDVISFGDGEEERIVTAVDGTTMTVRGIRWYDRLRWWLRAQWEASTMVRWVRQWTQQRTHHTEPFGTALR